jgi:periplasmic mercuric ion binding protein
MKLVILSSIVMLTSLTTFLPVDSDVTVKGVHLCCGSCVDAVNDALDGIDGVSGIACDQNTKVATFKAANDEAAEKGIKALAEAGFFGAAKNGKKDLLFPDAGAKKDVKSAKVKFAGVHLCCRSCVKDAHTALKDVKGVSSIDVDREAGTVTLSGTDIVQTEALAALNKGGFYGKVSE